MSNIKPLKRFGQNYLIDKNILRKIAAEILPQPQDNIIEIGPGTGALTELLVNKVEKLTAVEIDFRVIEDLRAKFPSLNLLHADFLNLDLESLIHYNKNKLRIVGNIPYNLTSPILFKMIENNDIIKDAVLMVQNEVAQRITAKKDSKEYGILAVLLQFFAEVKIIFKISPNVFFPKPKVYSALIHIIFKEIKMDKEEKMFFLNIVKASFGNRRKIIKNSLSNSIFAEINFKESNINLELRAEQLNIEDFLTLAEFARKNFHNNIPSFDKRQFSHKLSKK
jgi:16S rRNA (adenine1518-N6/adenine1519-N6)-dimethyltransferase